MIYFITKTVTEEEGVIIKSQYFESIAKSIESIENGTSLKPDYIISSDIKMFDISYKDATLIVTEDSQLKVVADIVLHGINGTEKSDEFVINTIKEIHKDKIKATSHNKKSIGSVDLTKIINDCRDGCLDACASGVASQKKIAMEFLELKTKLGLNINHGAVQN